MTSQKRSMNYYYQYYDHYALFHDSEPKTSRRYGAICAYRWISTGYTNNSAARDYDGNQGTIYRNNFYYNTTSGAMHINLD